MIEAWLPFIILACVVLAVAFGLAWFVSRVGE